MFSLFIDTHDALITLALYKDGKFVDKKQKESTMHHSDYIMPMLVELLNDNNITVHDLSEILCINDPGSFTRVRLGVTIAKTLAYTLNIKIKVATSLEMYAVSSNIEGNKLAIIKDLKGAFGGLFDKDNNLNGEYFYMNNSEFNEYVEKNNFESIIVENNIDFDKIYDLFSTKQEEIAHKVNPLYIKVIEALKHD
jgi:tRNA threonylcarbamoyladenosine biosynthesis protein TsaB